MELIIKSKKRVFPQPIKLSFILSDFEISVRQMENYINREEFSRSNFLLYAHQVKVALKNKQNNYSKIKNQAFLIDIMFRKM